MHRAAPAALFMPLSPCTVVAVSRLFQRGLRPLLAASFLACALAPAAAQVASTEVVFLRHTNALVTTTVGQLGTEPETRTFITGLASNQFMVALDTRPQTQGLFGLAVDVVANSLQLYHLHPGTGAATAVAPAFQIHGFSGQPVFFELHPWDMDYDPKTDTLRVVQGTLNFRIHATTGLPVDTHAVNAGNQPDAYLTGNLEGCAYSNSQPDATQTTLCTLDPATGQLQIRSPENATVLTVTKPLTVAGVPLQFDGVSGFDIAPGVNVTQDGAAPYGFGYAILHAADKFTLYRIHLATGEATAVTPVASRPISFTFRPRLSVAVALEGNDTNTLVTFSPTAAVPTFTPRPVSGLTAGETLAALDVRASTGQLYGLGVNAATDSATLYLIQPRLGTLTPVGTRSSIRFVRFVGILINGQPWDEDPSDLLPINLPPPGNLIGYDMDFQPGTSHLHIVVPFEVGSALGFRVDADTGAPVDGDNSTPTPVPGINLDAQISGDLQSIGFIPAGHTNTKKYGVGSRLEFHTLHPTRGSTNVWPSHLLDGPGSPFYHLYGLQSQSSLDFYSETRLEAPDATGTPVGLLHMSNAQGNNLYRLDPETLRTTFLMPLPATLQDVTVFAMPPRGLLIPTLLPAAAAGQNYRYYFDLESVGQYSYREGYLPGTQLTATGLPPGLKISRVRVLGHGSNPQVYYALSGRATVAGTYVITFTARTLSGQVQTYQTTLVVRPLSAEHVGSFIAYIPPHPSFNEGIGSRLDLTTTTQGTYTLKVTESNRTHLHKGSLEVSSDGLTATLNVTLKTGRILRLDFADTGTPNSPITGLATDPSGVPNPTAPIRGWRKIYDKVHAPATQLAGYYTAAFTPQTDSRYVPQGDGFATLTIGQDGSSRIIGKMPDGTAITCAAFIGGPAEVFVYAPLFQKRGSLFGSLPLSLPSGTPSLSGSLTYNKPVTRGRLYPEFIAYEPFTVTGGYLAPTASSSQVLGLPQASTPASLLFTRAGIEDSATVPDLLSSIFYTAPKATLPLPGSLDNPGRVTLRIHPGNGQITGTFTLKDGKVKRTVKYQGLIIRRAGQPQILGSGYFHLPQLPETGQTPATSPILSGLLQLTQ